ncbi:low molecular weight phosphotyrosine protein phosphatase [Helicobacter sp. MIT 21-1697]|uniref:low molecular weight protein-tyrosine-phosphatase n=1 Tax=Helicobacter sp. MIT 21-1697 TaxID=2993733 RepID=UPI00224AF883|nr:low molecular weight protein-tyrosine-phosphatase [Helicobacter sp. MIT 21-1697]MCX2716688.1 low molecular weight phosphotyrosine protein phosphatase [Helicobacter sp. MIT 21-1697]
MKSPKPLQSILFVCLGNICRSPLAQGIARHITQQHHLNIELDSAGTSGWHIDEEPCAGSRYIAKKHGFSIDDLRGRRVSVYADDTFDLIIALDKSNYADLLALGFDKAKVKKLGEFGLKGADIPDPYTYKDMEGFERIYQMIYLCVHNLLSIHYPVIESPYNTPSTKE